MACNPRGCGYFEKTLVFLDSGNEVQRTKQKKTDFY
jgi:hypothetical protein